jgi:hypothetical protein
LLTISILGKIGKAPAEIGCLFIDQITAIAVVVEALFPSA